MMTPKGSQKPKAQSNKHASLSRHHLAYPANDRYAKYILTQIKGHWARRPAPIMVAGVEPSEKPA
jgi:hypothetical protein